MSWLGKILGGGLGMLLGGPLGALVGAGLGHAFVDAQGGVGGLASRAALSEHERRQMVFFTTTFAMLGKMAKADGTVSDDEIRLVETFMRDRLGLQGQARRVAIALFNEAKTNTAPFSAYATQFAQVFADDPNSRRMLYEMLYQVALADGRLHPEEEALLAEARTAFVLGIDVDEQLRRRHGGGLERDFAVLGITSEADAETVKKAYRAAVREHHPDTVVARGLPEEFVKVAEEKFKEIQEAYDRIQARRTGEGAR